MLFRQLYGTRLGVGFREVLNPYSFGNGLRVTCLADNASPVATLSRERGVEGVEFHHFR